MNQFKDVFLGADKRAYQPCHHGPALRAGLAASTMTWKTSAIPPVTTPSSRCWATSASVTTSNRTPSGFAWEFLTGTLKLPKERLLVTVYATDDEAFDIWAKGRRAGRSHRAHR